MVNVSPKNNEIRAIIEAWADATRQNRKDDILRNHAADLVIFDVLPPMKYDGAESYRRSWGDWQPKTQGDAVFALEDLSITAGVDTAFAFCFIRCGGALPDGKIFHDLVRATFCLINVDGGWIIKHQHVSKPHEWS